MAVWWMTGLTLLTGSWLWHAAVLFYSVIVLVLKPHDFIRLCLNIIIHKIHMPYTYNRITLPIEKVKISTLSHNQIALHRKKYISKYEI